MTSKLAPAVAAVARANELLAEVKAAHRKDASIRDALVQAFLDGAAHQREVDAGERGFEPPKKLKLDAVGRIENQALGLVPMVLRLRMDLEPPGRIFVDDKEGEIEKVLERANEPELWTWLGLQEPLGTFVRGGYDYQAERLHIYPEIAEGESWK